MTCSGAHRSLLASLLLAITILATGGLGGSVYADAPSGSLYDLADLARLERTFQKLARDTRPSVVAVETFRRVTPGRGGRVLVRNSQGAGFVFRSDGYIVTNHHVVEDADRIDVVLFNGAEYEAKVVEFDPRSDLAVIRIDAQNLRVAPLGDASEVRPGRWAYTVGNPFGLANRNGNTSVSFGTVSAIGQSLDDRIDSEGNDRYYGNLIQTDAGIAPGNSGGPLFNIRGQVIGIATAMEPRDAMERRVGFAIPLSARTRRILATLAAGNRVRYGYLGVKVFTPDQRQARRDGVPDGRGAVIASLTGDASQSPAARAGLRPDDIITIFDGQRVKNHDELVRLAGATPVGSEVEVIYYREKRRHTTHVKLIERAETVAARVRSTRVSDWIRATTWRGITLVEPTRAFLLAHGVSRDESGLYVHDVPRQSLLWRRGLREGAFIVKVNGKDVRTLEDFARHEKEATDSLLLELKSGATVVVPN